MEPVPDKFEVGVCPDCGKRLFLHFRKGKYFIGCSEYPRCKYIKKGFDKPSSTFEIG
ncbi:MAG: topoisomerase DNA-binding C4 zinc finger domain-containing protein [Bacilli bacterium]|nr:topoisomerase DNA-binding C4 zinc finger domain-containing protein [Bacilli bacterium]